ncbi:MAG TPA: ABC transporter substrate-binding protein [Blastocatellia bacterium]|nr:ABC transporter substrate-binding protein [Blastocatellia bacterium]
MKSNNNRIRFALALIALVLFGWSLSERRTIAQSAVELSPQEKRGKQIYLKGESEGGEMNAVLGTGDLDLPASSFPCANCHGLRGEGSSEGGLQPPSLIWNKLTSPGQSALTRLERGPYNETTLARAITAGINSNGGKLHPGMPHYRMTGEQMADLIAYLKKIGKELDVDPGLSDEAIKVGAALPMTGPLARIGEDVKQALGAYFAEINKQGGIYGRKFELVVADSRGDAAGTAEATKQLVEQHGVFALVGSFEPSACEATNEYLKRLEVPLIGPVTLSPRQPVVPNPYVFYLLPSFADQSRSLAEFISAGEMRSKTKAAPRLAVIFAENDLDQDAVSGLKSQARIHAMEIVAEQSYKAGQFSAGALVKPLSEKKPDYIFFFGSGDDFTAFANEIDRVKLDAGLLSSAVMIGRSVFNLPPAIAAKTYLSYSVSMPDRDDFAEFVTVMQKSGVQLRSAAFQAVAFAAAKIFVEAARSGTRQLSRTNLIRSLEQFHNYATGVIAPITFGPNRRTGASGSYIVKIDLDKKQYVAVSDRIIPKAGNQ